MPPRALRLYNCQGKNVRAVASDGRRVVVCEARGYTHVIGRRTGAIYRLHVGEETKEALVDGEVLYLVGGETGLLRAVGLVDGEKRPCPGLTGAEGLRAWAAPDAPLEHGLVASHFDGQLRTFDASHAPMATFGPTDMLEAFDVHHTTVVAAYAGAPLQMYNCRTGALTRAASRGPTAPVLGVHIDNAGIVTSDDAGDVTAYDPELRTMLTARVPDRVGRLHADPRDSQVLHALGSTAALRIDRKTLEVIDRVPVISLHDALCVDALGRLVGVDGGVDMLDPLPPPPAPDPDVPDIEARYDRDATFDKDIPGMSATAVEVWQDARRITICTWYHEEGSRRGDMTVQHGTLERVEGNLVHLAMDDGTRARFDLTARRLV